METGNLSNTVSGDTAANLTVITGGARSGKSVFAESVARESGQHVYYLATMQELSEDEESCDRIRRHRQRRPEGWQTFETPSQAGETIRSFAQGPAVCIFDCLSLYISNILLAESAQGSPSQTIEAKVDLALAEILAAVRARPDITFLIVTNEVGWGIVPENGLARLYRDLLGLGNQTMAGIASQVWLLCAGLQLRLK